MGKGLQRIGLRVIVLAFRVAGLNKHERMVLAAIASHADATGLCWPGEELLAAETSLSERAVRYAVRSLKGRGLVRATTRGGTRSNLYQLEVDAIEGMPRVGRPRLPMTGTPGQMTGTACRSGEDVQQAPGAGMTGTPCLSVTGTACRLTEAVGTDERSEQGSSSLFWEEPAEDDDRPEALRLNAPWAARIPSPARAGGTP